MKMFRDNENREWQVAVNLASIKRCIKITGVNLPKACDEHESFVALANDPMQVGEVLYALCQPQAEERGITQELFGAALAGECLESATQCLLRELADFFSGDRAKSMHRAISEMGKCQAEADRVMQAKIDSIDLPKMVAQQVGDSFDSAFAAFVSKTSR